MALGSGLRDPEKTYSGSGIPDPGVKKAPDPGSGSATLARKTKIKNRRYQNFKKRMFPVKLRKLPGIHGRHFQLKHLVIDALK
jgi:hypothetical protein